MERRRGPSGGVALRKEGSAGSAPSVMNAVNPSHLCVGEGRVGGGPLRAGFCGRDELGLGWGVPNAPIICSCGGRTRM